MKNTIITALLLVLSPAVPALAAQQDIAQLSAVTASREALRTAVNTQLSAVQSNFDELYTAVGTRPWVIQATAPADTTLAWFDTDQVVDAVVLKIHNGERWVPQAIGEGGSYTLPTAAADTLGGIKVGSRLTITDGVLSADVQTGDGDDLGSAAYSDVVALWTTCTGYLKSDGTCDTPSGSATYPSAEGVANWDGSAWGASYTVGTGASNLVQLNESAQLPAVSADLLTITDTGTYFTTDTVAAALQELGSGLADVTEITLDASLTETGGVLSVTNPATDYDTDGDGDFTDESWFPAAGIGGSTGSTDNAILRANGTGGSTAQASGVTIDDNDNLATSGTIKGRTLFNSYAADQTLTAATHNSTVVQATEAIEITMWDCETVNVGDTVLLWARDAEKIEVAPSTGDGFALFDGTALTAGNELDVAATKGTKVTLMCTADDLWSVFHETAPATDGGAAD